MPDLSYCREFEQLAAAPDEAVDLARAALLIARTEYPGLDVDGYLGRLDAIGRELRERLAGESKPLAAARVLNRYLFLEQGFRGNVQEYYDPRNSFLNDVIDRRLGIPITLSTVYMEVAGRVGLEAEGVGLPGHFIVRVRSGSEELLVDPYYRGIFLTEQDCQKRLDRVYGGRVRIEPWMLAACERKHILARMLRNLKAIYLKTQDETRALRSLDLLLLLDPASREDLKDRGLLYASLDCYGLAVTDLERYLATAEADPEADEILEKVAELRRKAARLN